MFYSYEFVNAAIFGAMTLLAGVVFLTANRIVGAHGRAPLRILPFAAVILIAADLMIASYSFNPASDPALLDFTPPAIAWLQNQPGEWRYTTYEDPVTTPHLLNANETMQYGLRDVRGYESIIPKQYVDYMKTLAPQVQLDYNRIAPIYTTYGDGFDPQQALTSPILNVLGVRYIVSGKNSDLSADDFTLAYEDQAVRIWENPHVLPLAYQLGTRGVTRPVTITSDTGREKLIDVNVTDPGFSALIVHELYAPGWRAYIRTPGAGKDQGNAGRSVAV